MEEVHSSFPWILTLNFLILATLLYVLLRKNVARSILERHDTFKSKMDEAETLRLNAEKMLADYDQKLKRLDQEVQVIMAEAKASAEKEKALILQRADLSAQKIIDQAKAMAEQSAKHMEQKIRAELTAKAIEDARKRLTEENSVAHHRAFLDSFFTEAQVTRG